MRNLYFSKISTVIDRTPRRGNAAFLSQRLNGQKLWNDAPFGYPGNMYQLRAQVWGIDAHNSLYTLFVGIDLVSHVTNHTDGLAIKARRWLLKSILNITITQRNGFQNQRANANCRN